MKERQARHTQRLETGTKSTIHAMANTKGRKGHLCHVFLDSWKHFACRPLREHPSNHSATHRSAPHQDRAPHHKQKLGLDKTCSICGCRRALRGSR
eukprot:2494358-Rhodomonas_salina.3